MTAPPTSELQAGIDGLAARLDGMDESLDEMSLRLDDLQAAFDRHRRKLSLLIDLLGGDA